MVSCVFIWSTKIIILYNCIEPFIKSAGLLTVPDKEEVLCVCFSNGK